MMVYLSSVTASLHIRTTLLITLLQKAHVLLYGYYSLCILQRSNHSLVISSRFDAGRRINELLVRRGRGRGRLPVARPVAGRRVFSLDTSGEAMTGSGTGDRCQTEPPNAAVRPRLWLIPPKRWSFLPKHLLILVTCWSFPPKGWSVWPKCSSSSQVLTSPAQSLVSAT